MTIRLTSSLMLMMFLAGLFACGKTSDQKVEKKKAKEVRSGAIELSEPRKW